METCPTHLQKKPIGLSFKQECLKKAIQARQYKLSIPVAPPIPLHPPSITRTQFMYNNSTKVVHIKPKQPEVVDRIISSGPLQPVIQVPGPVNIAPQQQNVMKPMQALPTRNKVVHIKPNESQPRILDQKLNVISGPKEVMEAIEHEKEAAQIVQERQSKPKFNSKMIKKRELLFERPLNTNELKPANPTGTKKFPKAPVEKKKGRNDQQGWRMGRAKRHMIHLIQAEQLRPYQWRLAIRGNQGKVYEVSIKDKLSCTCQDFINNQKPCKHLFFAIINVADSKKVVEDTASSIKLDEQKLRVICINLKERVKRLTIRSEEVDLPAQLKLSAKMKQCLICFKRLGKVEYLETCSKCRTRAHRQCLRAYFSQTTLCPVCKIKFQNTTEEPPAEVKQPKVRANKKAKTPVQKAPKPAKPETPPPEPPKQVIMKQPTVKIPSRKPIKEPQHTKVFQQEEQEFDPLAFLNNHSDSDA